MNSPKADIITRRHGRRLKPIPQYSRLGRRAVPGQSPESRGARANQRFTRRLLSVMRNPIAPLSRVLCRELKTRDMKHLRQTLPAGSDAILRVVVHFAIALRRLLLVLDWREFVAISQVPPSGATANYVRLLRRRHVKISKSALYKYQDEFKKRGLNGLVPGWRGGRPRRIPLADRALLRALFCQRNPYNIYRAARKHARLVGHPITASAARQVMAEFLESEQAIRRLPPREGGSCV